MKSGDYAWLAIAIGVATYELGAALHRDGELLSEACDRYRRRHPVITTLTITYLAAHLTRVWPKRVDPLTIATSIGRRITQ